jgi:hypothetical protein
MVASVILEDPLNSENTGGTTLSHKPGSIFNTLHYPPVESYHPRIMPPKQQSIGPFRTHITRVSPTITPTSLPYRQQFMTISLASPIAALSSPDQEMPFFNQQRTRQNTNCLTQGVHPNPLSSERIRIPHKTKLFHVAGNFRLAMHNHSMHKLRQQCSGRARAGELNNPQLTVSPTRAWRKTPINPLFLVICM